MRLLFVATLALACFIPPPAPRLTKLRDLPFVGEIKHNRQLSGVAHIGRFLLAIADEAGEVVVLRPEGSAYRAQGAIPLPLRGGPELDAEGIAAEGDTVYVLGSHSWKRPALKPTETFVANRELLTKAVAEPSRDRLFRFRLTAEGKAERMEETSLRQLIDHHPVLGAFAQVPGKENGVDFEGLAVRNGLLYAGCRGPVLRQNWVPVLAFAFRPDSILEAQSLYLNLGGRGVRDLVAVRDGFLVVAGPVGDGPGGYRLYHWNGHDCLPGERKAGEPQGECRLLTELALHATGKPEGLLVLDETATHYDLLFVFDGAENGAAAIHRLRK